MKHLVLALAGFVCSSAAMAADLPHRTAPPPFVPPPALLFEGFYAGVQLGGLGYGDRSRDIFTPTNATLFHKTAHGGSFVGGVHAGYDWRYGPLVAGVVGDINGARAENSSNDAFGLRLRNQVDAQGSLRGRVGLNYERALLYVTGGASLAGLRHDYTSPIGTQTKNWFIVSPTVGAGVEYAVDDRWSGKIEYRITPLGSGRDQVAPGLAIRHDAAEGLITAGVSYHFGK